MGMRVGEVSRRTGVGVSTLRAWERRFGILRPARSPTGQRLYTETDVDRVAAVCRLVAEGLTLSSAANRVTAAGTGALPTGEGEAFVLHQVFQAADQGIWVSQDGRTRYANRRMAELMRTSIDDLLARSVLDFIEPESHDVVRERGRLGRDGRRQRFEVRLRRGDGSTFLAEVGTTPLRDTTGNYSGAVAVVSDVTARHEADAEARFRTALLDAIGEAVLASRPDGTIVYANPAAERLFGWRATELVGQNGLELIPSPVATAESTRIHGRLLAGGRHSAEFDLLRRDGSSFLAHITGAPVRDDHGELVGLIAVLSDNSEKHRIEQDVRSQEQQAETVALLGAHALQHSARDDDLILTEILESTRRVLQCERAAILEATPAGDEFIIRQSSPASEVDGTAVPSGSRSLTGYTALAGKVVFIDDVRRDRRCEVYALPGRDRILSAVAAPVLGPHGVLGVLIAGDSMPHRFGRSAVPFMQSIANVVGVVLARATAEC